MSFRILVNELLSSLSDLKMDVDQANTNLSGQSTSSRELLHESEGLDLMKREGKHSSVKSRISYDYETQKLPSYSLVYRYLPAEASWKVTFHVSSKKSDGTVDEPEENPLLHWMFKVDTRVKDQPIEHPKAQNQAPELIKDKEASLDSPKVTDQYVESVKAKEVEETPKITNDVVYAKDHATYAPPTAGERVSKRESAVAFRTPTSIRQADRDSTRQEPRVGESRKKMKQSPLEKRVSRREKIVKGKRKVFCVDCESRGRADRVCFSHRTEDCRFKA